MPVIPGLTVQFGNEAAVSLDPFQWKAGFTYNAEKGAQRWNLLNDLIGAYLIDNHHDLAAVWNRVRMLKADNPLVLALARPPLEEEEAMRLAKEDWNQPEKRSRIRSQWSAEARERYQRLAEQLP